MRRAPLLVLLSALAVPSPIRAEGAALPLELDWQAPPECASSEELRAELARVARVKTDRVVPRLAAHGRIEKRDGAYRLTLRTERNGEAGERSLAAAECRSLEREVTLVLAVAFGEGVEIVDEGEPAAPGEGGKPEAPPQPAPSAAPEAPPASERARARDVARRPRDPSRWRAAFLAGGGVLFAALPSPASFATAGVEVGTKHVWLAPRVYWLPRVDDELSRGVHARYDGFGGGLAVCAGLPLGDWLANACAGWELLRLRGRSWGASESGEAAAPLHAAGASAGLGWPERSAVSLRLAAALQVALDRPRFVVEGLGEVHRVPRLSPTLAAALVLAPWR